jgi:hypothetical protein
MTDVPLKVELVLHEETLVSHLMLQLFLSLYSAKLSYPIRFINTSVKYLIFTVGLLPRFKLEQVPSQATRKGI